jgi:hypothetical protein
MGSGFVILFISVVYQAIIYLLHRILASLNLEWKWVNRHEREAFFNLSIKTLQEGSLEFMICGIINLTHVSFVQSFDFWRLALI